MEPASVVYRLEENAIASRARVAAAIGSASNLGPALLVVVLLVELRYLSPLLALSGTGVLGALALARATLKYRQIVRHLRAFEVVVGEAFLVVKTVAGDEQVAREAVERLIAIDGALGGLRVELAPTTDEDEGRRLDIPRGGERFGDLRAELATWRPVERAPDQLARRRWVRGALIVVMVFSIFFVPFFMDDLVGRSRPLTIALVFALWLAMLIARGRG